MMNIKFDDLVLKRKDLDLLEYEANFFVESSHSEETEAGILQITMTGSFRPHMQAESLAFSDFEFEQYVWDRIMEHVEEYIHINPVRIITLPFKSGDIDKERAEHFRKSTLPTLPDYTKKENRLTTRFPDLLQVPN